jgi:hypothetical protein
MAANMVGLEPDTFAPPGIDNVARCYYALFAVALRKYQSSAPGDFDKALDDCERLLLYSDLPLMVRARCHILLSTRSNEEGTAASTYAMEHADTAVRLLDKDVRSAIPEGGEFPQGAYDEAVRIRNLLIEEEKEIAEAEAAAQAESEDLPDNI